MQELLRKLYQRLGYSLLQVGVPAYVGKCLLHVKIISMLNGNNPIGFIAFYINQKNKETALITQLTLDKAHKGRSYRRALVEAATNIIFSDGFKNIIVRYLHENRIAPNFAKAQGFKLFTDNELERLESIL